MKKTTIAWAAGVLEGEGTFWIDRNNERKGFSPGIRIRCVMTDQDIIERLHAEFGVGTLRGPYRPHFSEKWPGDEKRFKSLYAWSVSRKKDTVWVLEQILPFMGTRRTERILQMLEVASATKPVDGLQTR